MRKKNTDLEEMYKKIYSDENIKAMAEATVQMIKDPTNNIIAVIPDKDGKPVFITRE